MAIYNLNTKRRKTENKEDSGKNLRIHGEIPVICYSKNAPSIALKVSQKEIDALLHSRVGLIKLNIEGEKSVMAVAKEIQKDPVTQRPIHVTLEGVKEGEMVHLSLPVKLEYSKTCHWVKENGRANQKAFQLNVEVGPKEIPEEIVINIDHLDFGDHLLVSDLKFPKLKFLDNPNIEVVSVNHVKIQVDEPEEIKETTLEATGEKGEKTEKGDKGDKGEKETTEGKGRGEKSHSGH